jgi:hypothetical protein
MRRATARHDPRCVRWPDAFHRRAAVTGPGAGYHRIRFVVTISASERQAICKVFATLIAEETTKLRARINSLEARLNTVERRGLEYVGTHQRAQRYRAGSVCTHSGSMWVAITDTEPNEVPGASDRWQLCVKAGRDAEPRRPTAPTTHRPTA